MITATDDVEKPVAVVLDETLILFLVTTRGRHAVQQDAQMECGNEKGPRDAAISFARQKR